jgi:CheY-like chemotaxis protein
MEPAQLLVVEDDDDLRELLSEQLASYQFSVAQARNGQEALDYLASRPPPRLVLLDLVMPVMDGLEFLARRRRHAHWALIPVFAFTGFEASAAKASADVERVFGKPLDFELLLRAVREVLLR